MKKLIKNLLASILVALSGFGFSYSQADTSILENLTLKDLLNLKVTTASKVSEELEKAPATVLVVTGEQIKIRGYQSLLDVIYDLPDIKVDDKIYSGIRNTFTLRGTQGQEKFMILLDGNRISSPSGEAMPIMENYPVNLAQQIEIVYGPASALYGADAMSGVINIITKKSSLKKGFSINASSIAGNYGYTNNSLFIAKKISDDVNFVISGQYSYDNQPDYSKLYKNDNFLNTASHATGTFNTIYGLFTPIAPIKPKFEAPMEAYNIFGSLHSNSFSFNFFRNYSKTPTAFGNNTSNAVYNKEVFMSQSINMANATYKKSFDDVTATTIFTASEYNLSPKSNFRNLYTFMEPAYRYSICSMIKAEEQLDYKMTSQLNFTGGLGYESYYSIPRSTDLEEPVNSKEYIHGVNLGTKAYYRPNGLEAQFYFIRYHNIGSYLQAQYSPSQKISLAFGARYDINSRYGSSFNPRLGLVYNISNKTTIKAMYGSAFLAPSPSESYSQYGAFETLDSGRSYHSYFLHLPNTDLKPITSRNFELILQQYFSDNCSISVNGYYTKLSGLHAFADDNQSTHLYNNLFNGIPVEYIEVFINRARQTNYGGSIRVNWKNTFGRIRVNSYASLSYVNGRIDNALKEADETTPDAQPEFISPVMFKIGADIKSGKFSFAPRLSIIGEQNVSGIKDTVNNILHRQTLPGYALLNISIRYNVSKQLSAFTNITNALDQRYRSVGFNMDLNKQKTEVFHGQPEDPIRIMAGFNFSF
jgi:outer membrane receptor for ferrienterochelin and colicin